MFERGPQQQNNLLDDIKREFTTFLQNADASDPQLGGRLRGEPKKYIQLIEQMLDQESSNVLPVRSRHLVQYNDSLAEILFEDYYKYEKLINQTLTELCREIKKEAGIMRGPDQREDEGESYYVIFDDGVIGYDIGIRELTSAKIGKLYSLVGTVTRTSEVRPQLTAGVFKCTDCASISRKIEQQFKYTQPKKCLNPNCDSRSWELMQVPSQFADFQLLRVQEDPNSIPPGGMPRSINIVLRNHNVETAQPGDLCKFVGYLCVSPQISSMLKPGERTTLVTRNNETRGNAMEMDGVKGLKGIRQLNYKFVFIANNVIVKNKQVNEADFDTGFQEIDDQENEQNNNSVKYEEQVVYHDLFKRYNQSEMKIIIEMKENPRLYNDMAESIFTGIFGHSQIKKSLLLQLLGGVHKVTNKNKINIRGDINVLIVGDPSTAKSQFLKAVNKFIPRSIYTNGKTTSAAGLTASVVRDDQGNVSIEAGALMLADNGVCCIDEFDKMNLADITAIHEAMEQQTISIAKAGVHATLNARTSILAAANPLFGRYDKSKNLQKNINISPPIMSRFDLFFVVCDESNPEIDANLCDFILRMHRQRQNAVVRVYEPKQIRFYISIAKRLKPRLTHKAAQKLRDCYIKLRQSSKVTGGSSYIATVRQLESMIRLSEALARLHLNVDVTEQYVEEAYRLISNSIIKLEKPVVQLQDAANENKQNRVHNILEEEVDRKEREKKEMTISISAEVYTDLVDTVLKLFKEKQRIQLQSGIDEQIEVTQGNIINYVLTLEMEKGTVNTEDQERNYRKIVRAVIKKMINKERMLMVQSEDSDENERQLKLHPNYIPE